MTLQIEAREALIRIQRYPSRDVYVRPTGHVYWPSGDECPLPGEVWIAGGEHGAWTADDLERAMIAAAGVAR